MFRFIVVAICILLLVMVLPVWADNHDSLFITGNEPQLANNIVITIDDNFIESDVRAMFHILHKRGLTATFFPVTKYMVRQNPQLWREIVAAGFEIGYHTRRHSWNLTPAQLDKDFPAFQDEVRKVLGNPNYTIRYVRPPGGLWNQNWLSWAHSRGLITVKWNDSAPGISLATLAGILKNRQRGGSIIIMHASRADADWLEKNIDALMALKDSHGKPYRIENLTAALND